MTYYLAESEGGSLSGRQGEILQVRMLPYEEALKVFDRPATRRILTRANELLTGRPEKEWQIEFRTSHEKMIEAVLEKSQRSCPDGLDLLGVYGSAATGDMHDRSDLDLLIVPSGVEAGPSLSIAAFSKPAKLVVSAMSSTLTPLRLSAAQKWL